MASNEHKYKKYKHKYTKLKNDLFELQHKIIAISGISGSGKSTVAQILSNKLNGIYIDQDWFYVQNKDKVRLSNGVMKINYDYIGAIDKHKLNSFLHILLKQRRPIILAGFALRDDILDNDIHFYAHIHLKIPANVSLETRLKMKGFREKDKENQILMFNEVTVPFYNDTLKHSKITYEINVMKNSNEKININDEIKLIIDHIFS